MVHFAWLGDEEYQTIVEVSQIARVFLMEGEYGLYAVCLETVNGNRTFLSEWLSKDSAIKLLDETHEYLQNMDVG